MQLYTLYATPDKTIEFVMVASLETIRQYLRADMVWKTEAHRCATGAGEYAFGMDDRPVGYGTVHKGLPGWWMLVPGARVPLGTSVKWGDTESDPEGEVR